MSIARHAAVTTVAIAAFAASGGRVYAAGPYAVGSSNTANIAPAIGIPGVTPCTVALFDGVTFGANGVPYGYTPPTGCGTRWAKIVLRTTISVDAGRQFDRTGQITLGGVTLWFGTTAEPRAALAPSWTVDDDVTRDTALFRKPRTGRVLIANYQSSVYTSTIHASAVLLFYPATPAYPAPTVPDLVIPIAGDADGGPASLGTPTDALTTTLSLPLNVQKAELDLTLQGQGNDEFWYTCVPDALATALETCGGGAFRQGVVWLDGIAAGQAPAFPLIFTGGIDPYLWEPVPGVETLDIKPFRVDLTPFAGPLSDGRTHSLSVSVAGANSSFSAFGTLYVTLDKLTRHVTGAVVANSLATTGAAAPVVTSQSSVDGANTATHVATTHAGDYTITGYADTALGRITTSVHATASFSNVQDFLIGPAVYDQTVTQQSRTSTETTRRDAFGIVTHAVEQQTAPLELVYDDATHDDGSQAVTTTVAQALHDVAYLQVDGVTLAIHDLSWTAAPSDTLDFDASGSVTAHSGGTTGSDYALFDTIEGCALVHLAAQANTLTAASASASCADALRSLAK